MFPYRSDHPQVRRVVYAVFEQLHKGGRSEILHRGRKGEEGDRRSPQPRFKVSGFPGEEKLRSLPYEELPKVVIHNDIRCENLLFRGNKLMALFDFARSIYAPRVLDLATAISNLVSKTDNTLFIDSSHEFMTAYKNKAHLSNVEMESLPVLTQGRIVWQVQEDTEDGVERCEPAEASPKIPQIRPTTPLARRPPHVWQGVFS